MGSMHMGPAEWGLPRLGHFSKPGVATKQREPWGWQQLHPNSSFCFFVFCVFFFNTEQPHGPAPGSAAHSRSATKQLSPGLQLYRICSHVVRPTNQPRL